MIVRRCLGWDGRPHRPWRVLGIRRSAKWFVLSDGMCKTCAARMAARVAERKKAGWR